LAQLKSSSKKAAAKPAAQKRSAPAKSAKTAKKTAKKAAKKTVAKKADGRQAAKLAPAKKTVAKKTVAKKAPAKKAAAKNTAKKEPAKKAAKKQAKKPPEKKAAAKKAPAKKAPAGRGPRDLVVLPQEKPWTAAEIAEVRGQLEADRDRFRAEVSSVEQGIQDLLRAGGEGAGNDQADVGSTSLERDSEMSLANNTRDMLIQTERALERLDDRTYGVCESCGNPIGKRRLMVFPRATLCMTCKQREERR